MVQPTTLLSGLTAVLTLQERKERKEAERERDNTGDTPDEAPTDMEILSAQEATSDKLDKLVAIEEKNQPSPGDKDAFASAVVELDPGETAEVTVEPSDGHNMRVKRVYFDRRDNHEYEFNVAGEVTSVAHRAKYVSPKLVAQSDRVLARVTNLSAGSTVIDFELEAWAEKT